MPCCTRRPRRAPAEFALETAGAVAGPRRRSGPPLGDAAGWTAAAPAREFTLRLRRGEAAVWVEVFDPDLRLPRIRSAGENDEGGRGLYLVDQLATRWGSRPTQDGKAVWFEIPIKGGHGPGWRGQRRGTASAAQGQR